MPCFRHTPPLGWPSDSIQNWLQRAGAVGHNVESKQILFGGDLKSPATIIKTPLEILQNIMYTFQISCILFYKSLVSKT
jgi:hypothetical protein